MAVELKVLAERVANGDSSAFRSIVDHTRAQLYRLAARMVGNLVDAEDVLQDAFVNAYRGLCSGKYDGKAKVETWLHRIVANACIDHMRKRKVRATEELDHEPRFDGHVGVEARVALRELDQLLSGMGANERATLVLVMMEGFTAKEAGEILECSEGAIEQRLLRARAHLRTLQKEQANDV